jgi:hypothetical protein
MSSRPSMSRPSGTAERWNKVLDALETILAGPRWLRITTAALAAALAIFGGTVTIRELITHVSEFLNRKPTASGIDGAGIYDPSRTTPQSADMVKQELADLKHAEVHHELHDLIERHTFINNAEDGELTVEAYKSDKCVWMHRVDYKNHLEVKRWIHSDLKSVSPLKGANSVSWPPQIHDKLVLAGLNPEVDLSVLAGAPPAANVSLFQGHCLNPHPGQFRYWWGPPNGCWVPFNRQFEDGCHHIQWFNSCANVWDSRIQWDACYH